MTPHQNKHAAKTAYEIMDLPQGKPGFVRIIHVGAGASGLLAAYKAKKMLHNYELVCYDK
jgi:NADPH-dependent 2,4-dienoyl-CoA reductase/sulfur reductase-like enzyme